MRKGELSLKAISEEYLYLMPPKPAYGLVIINLYVQVKIEKSIPEEFSQEHIEYIREQVLLLLGDEVPYTETIVKWLLYNFIEPIPETYKYTLTNYAEKFVKLFIHKIRNPHREFPLQSSFKYLKLNSADIDTSLDLKSWYEQSFDATSKQTIIEHIEVLKNTVDKEIRELQKILNKTELAGVAMAKEFSLTFEKLGDKAKEVSKTLELKREAITEINKIVEKFYERIDNLEMTKYSSKTLSDLEHEYYSVVKIQEDIMLFFKNIDRKLDLIRMRVTFASSQLTRLKENLQAQSYFKTLLKRWLLFTLKNSLHDKGNWVLPPNYPLKKIPYEKFKFIGIPYYDFSVNTNNVSQNREKNRNYYNKKKKEFKKQLSLQKRVKEKVALLKLELKKHVEFDFCSHFKKMLNEKDLDLAIHVGFELFQFASKNPMYEINISTEPYFYLQDKFTVAIWNMKIINKNLIS